MSYTLFDALGTLGVLLIIVTYLLLQLQKIASGSLLYSVLNAVGASLVVVSLFDSFNFSAFIVEVFWVLISLIGIVRYYRSRGTENP